jgi:hypothetical protein
MNRSCRLFALVALATVTAACSQGVGSHGDIPIAPPTAMPSLAQNSLDPSPSPSETAPVPTTVLSASPTSSPIGTPSPTEPATDPATVLAANGIGPYAIGARLSELQSQALVTNIQPSSNCYDSWQHGEATGRYAGQLSFTFDLGRLTSIDTDAPELVTPSGARVGMPLTELQRIYGSRGTLITGVSGNQAISVRVPDTALGIVFFLDATNTKTWSMSAGEVERLEIAAVVGEGC